MDCIFCKIITGELPATKVYEDNDCLAFLDIYPVNPGHTLLIPKQHYDDLLSTPSEVVGKLYQAAQKVARGVMVGVGADAFNLGLNNGRAAGQVVFHTHIHIIPRLSADGLALWKQNEYKEGQMAEVGKKISQALL